MAIQPVDNCPTLGEAIRALSGVCDGAHARDDHGFNGADAPLGNKLAQLPEARWTLRQSWAAYRMLAKYRRQLASYGIDYDAIQPPPVPEQETPPRLPKPEIDLDPDPWDDAPEYVPPAEPERVRARDVLGPGGLIAQKLPGYEHREPQLAMADLCEQALDEEKHACVEAGTGTGKSLAYLVPAILSGKRVMVSTADKNLQGQIVGKDIPFLKSVMPRPFEAVLLKGRGNYVCRLRIAELQETAAEGAFKNLDDANAWPGVGAWLAETESGDIEEYPEPIPPGLRELITVETDSCLGRKCLHAAGCYAEQAKAKAREAQIVVVNHALLMRDLELRHRTDGHVSVVPNVDAVVIDEAHHLEDAATDAFGTELYAGRWSRIFRRIDQLAMKPTERALKRARQAQLGDDNVLEGQARVTRAELDVATARQWCERAMQAEKLAREVFDIFKDRLVKQRVTSERLGDEWPIVERCFKATESLAQDLAEGTPTWLDYEGRESWRLLAKQAMTLAEALSIAANPGVDNLVVRFIKLEGQGEKQRLVLCVKPIEVADAIQARLFDRFPTILTSATIAAESRDGGPFDYFKSRVGLDDALELQVQSPFDYKRNALLYRVHRDRAERFDSTRWRDDSVAYVTTLAEEIERLLLASDGRAFVLFTSYRTMLDVYDRLAPRLQRWLILRQGDLPRPELVRRFKQDGQAVLFGTKSFWEGVDVQGDALSMVIIDKLPFAPPDDPVYAARCDLLTKRTGDRWAWFSQLALPNAIIALKQGFGRLVRTKTDRGVVAILDGRLVTKPYGRQVIRSLPPAAETDSLEVVRAFFAR